MSPREIHAGRLPKVFALAILILRNRPRSKILLRPERTAGMDEKYFQSDATSSIHQQTCTQSWHR